MVGFYGLYLHVVRGFFSTEVISRVHLKWCSEDETFELKFSRGHNLCLKDDSLAASRVLARLFRCLVSGKAKVGAL